MAGRTGGGTAELTDEWVDLPVCCPGPVHPEDAREDGAHAGGGAVRVHGVRQEVHAEGSPQATPEDPRARETFQVSALRLQVGCGGWVGRSHLAACVLWLGGFDSSACVLWLGGSDSSGCVLLLVGLTRVVVFCC